MGPPDENWSLPSWAKMTNKEPPSDDISPGAPAMATGATPEETPAAAAEFSKQDQNISRQAPPTPVQPASTRKAQPDSPSVFDIGLSDATIKMFVSKAKPQPANLQTWKHWSQQATTAQLEPLLSFSCAR